MKDEHGSAIVMVLVVTIIILLVGMGLWYYETHPSSISGAPSISSLTATSSPTIAVSPSAAETPATVPLLNTSTWQIFQDQWLSFMYPAGWTIRKQDDADPAAYLYINIEQGAVQYPDFVTLESNPFYPPPQIASLKNGIAFIKNRLASTTLVTQEIPIANGDAFYFVNPGGMNEPRGPEAYLTSGDNIYDLSYTPIEGGFSPEDQQSTFLTILSTFQFASSSWSTYKNADKGYGISYPPGTTINSSDVSCVEIDEGFAYVDIDAGSSASPCGQWTGVGIGDVQSKENISIAGQQYSAAGFRTADNSQSFLSFGFTPDDKIFVTYGVNHFDESDPNKWKDLGGLTDSEYQAALESARAIVSTLKLLPVQ